MEVNFFQEKFQDPQTRQMNQPTMFRKKKNPRRTNYSSIFLRKFRIFFFSIIYMIRIRFFGPGELIQNGFRRARYASRRRGLALAMADWKRGVAPMGCPPGKIFVPVLGHAVEVLLAAARCLYHGTSGLAFARCVTALVRDQRWWLPASPLSPSLVSPWPTARKSSSRA